LARFLGFGLALMENCTKWRAKARSCLDGKRYLVLSFPTPKCDFAEEFILYVKITGNRDMSLAMAAGRKRKPGKREVNGRLLRALADRTSVAGTVKDLAIIARERLDPALASPLGRLLRLGEIRASEYDAGLKYRALRAATDRTLGLPARHPSGLDLNAAKGLSAFSAIQDPENDKAIQRAFFAAEDAIGRGANGSAFSRPWFYMTMPRRPMSRSWP
jgi:hypothetical protein